MVTFKVRVAVAVASGLLALGVAAYALWPEPVPRPHRPPDAYAAIPKIDVHVHVPPSRAREAVRVFARHGVRLALNASGGHPGPGLDASLAASRAAGGGLLHYCNLDFSRVEEVDWADYARRSLERCARDGAIGLKIYKSLGLGVTLRDGRLLRVDDPRLDVAFDAAGRLGLPVLIHTGDPQAFFRPPTEDNERYAELRAHPSWSFHGERPGGGRWPSWEALFAQFEARVARSPGTTFVGAHFGNAPEEPERVARMLDRYPNLVVDTGARIPEIGRHDPGRMRALFVRHRDRILFGTDIQMGRSGGWVLGSSGARSDPPARIPVFYERHWRYFETADRDFPHPTPIQGDWTIDGLDLPREVLEDLYHRNAERVFGLTLEGERRDAGR
jgi:predicted TIM-barrel fold metal-dependent hydrolase